MNAERMRWQPGRRLLGQEVAELAAYLTSKAARAQLEGPLTGALSLRAARKLEEAATISADAALFLLVMSADDCTGEGK